MKVRAAKEYSTGKAPFAGSRNTGAIIGIMIPSPRKSRNTVNNNVNKSFLCEGVLSCMLK
jgi:hypothetical protein